MAQPGLYPNLSAPWQGPALRSRNRLMHLSMTTRRSHLGAATPELIQYYENRARGGAGILVSEALNATRFQQRPQYVDVWRESSESGLKRWAEAVERHDSRMLGQFQDSGRGRHERGRNPRAIGVSALPDDLSWTVPHVLTGGEIRELIDGFAAAARRLEDCGFAGVELSAGHGHLFHQFMSPWSNRREDEYGGDFDGRLRFMRELTSAIRAATGPRFALGLKLPGDDGVPGSIDPPLAARIAVALAAHARPDYIAFCQGAHASTLDWHIPDMHWPRATWMPLIRELRTQLPGTAVVGLGLITDPAEAEGILARDEADLIGLGRPLVTDPAWPAKAFAGREAEIRYCVSCNTCWGQIVDHAPLACDNNPRVALPDEVDWHPARAATQRVVAVVGGGIAGLEAAWVAAARGHRVTLFTAGAEVGGKTRLHARLPGGESLSSIYDYQFLAARRAGVRFELGLRAGLADVLALAPDTVVLASGAQMLWPRTLPQLWREEGLVPDLRALVSDLIEISRPQGGTAVVFDMDHTEGTYAAVVLLKRLYDRVVIVTPRERIAGDVPLVTALGIHRRMARLGIGIVTHAELSALTALEEGIVRYANVHTGEIGEIGDVAALGYATPRAPSDALAAPLRAAGLAVHVIGDAYAPRTVLAATSDGHRVGNEL